MMPAAFRDEDGHLVSVSPANPLPVTGGGGSGGGGDASAANQLTIIDRLDSLEVAVGVLVDLLTQIEVNTRSVLVDEGV